MYVFRSQFYPQQLTVNHKVYILQLSVFSWDHTYNIWDANTMLYKWNYQNTSVQCKSVHKIYKPFPYISSILSQKLITNNP